jgi:sarcosine oxidase subunit gamma
MGGLDAQVNHIGRVTIAEIPRTALASVAARRGSEAATATLLGKFASAEVAGPGRFAGKNDLVTIWSGPDQWMVMARDDQTSVLAEELSQALVGKASVTEQTGAWVRFDISGDTRVDLLERLCPLAVRRMSPGDAGRSRIEHLGAFVLCTQECFIVLGASSSAGSLHHALTTAAHSVA